MYLVIVFLVCTHSRFPFPATLAPNDVSPESSNNLLFPAALAPAAKLAAVAERVMGGEGLGTQTSSTPSSLDCTGTCNDFHCKYTRESLTINVFISSRMRGMSSIPKENSGLSVMSSSKRFLSFLFLKAFISKYEKARSRKR